MKKKTRKKSKPSNIRQKKIETRRKRVLALYRRGFSCNKIAIKLQISAITVSSDLHALDKRVKVQKTKEKRNAAIIKKRLAGKTFLELSLMYDISENRVKEIIDNYNKVAETPIPDYRSLRNMRASKQRKSKAIDQPKITTYKLRQEKFTPKYKRPRPKPKIKKPTISAADRLNQILELRQAGVSVIAIAKKFNLSRNRIYQILNVHMPPKEKKITSL
ncbi:MAG: helix-turn-helix domain-containing protein [Planctomycetaceae bacterium]|jgi:transposase|nr:helix-turn-helix domain-containing protein [Planctomycetaceae bacterium]